MISVCRYHSLVALIAFIAMAGIAIADDKPSAVATGSATVAASPQTDTTTSSPPNGTKAPDAKPKNKKPVTAAEAKPPVNIPVPPRFLQVRERMAALFALRNDPPPPPDPRFNPFRPAGALPVAPLAPVEGASPLPAPVNNDLALLQQAIATMRVKGTVQLGKTLQLVINAGGKEGTYKEGDVINVNLSPDPVHLRVRVITRNGVTFTLGQAEMVLKF